MNDLIASFARYHGVDGGVIHDYGIYVSRILDRLSSTRMMSGTRCVSFHNVRLDEPLQDPRSCLTTRTSYVHRIVCDVSASDESRESTMLRKDVAISTFPAIVKQGLHDCSGHFIIDGQELVMPLKEVKRGIVPIARKNVTVGTLTVPYHVKIRCRDTKRPIRMYVHDSDVYLHMAVSDAIKDRMISVQLSRVLSCLNISVDEVLDDMSVNCRGDGVDSDPSTQTAWKESRIVTEAYMRIKRELDPGVTSKDLDGALGLCIPRTSRRELCMLFSYLLELLMRLCVGMMDETDIDDYENKTLVTPGRALADSYSRSVSKAYEAALKAFASKAHLEPGAKACLAAFTSRLADEIERSIYKPLRTGIANFGGRKFTSFSVAMGRRSPIDSASSIRRIVMDENANSPELDVRMVHWSQRRFVCLSETPEAKEVGLIKTLAMTCIVSPPVPGVVTIPETVLLPYDQPMIQDVVRVIIDGIPIGYCTDHEGLMSHLCRLRIQIKGYEHITWIQKGSNIHINTDAGRATRPMIAVDIDLESLLEDQESEDAWAHMLRRGWIIYADPMESKEGVPGYMDLDPITMFGMAASCIPYSNHNQCARNVFASSMIKQAISSLHVPFGELVCDTKWLVYGQEPLVTTSGMRFASYISRQYPGSHRDTKRAGKCKEHQTGLCKSCPSCRKYGESRRSVTVHGTGLTPNGCNVITAIMAYGGGNQEDSVIIKKSALERGLFTTCYTLVHRAYILESDTIIKHTSTEIYDQEGIIKVNRKITKEDVLFSYITDVGIGHPQMVAELLRTTVDDAFVVSHTSSTQCPGGKRCITIVATSLRKPDVGDKLSSRHAQKGVIGTIMEDTDMPFMSDGTAPDIIINPHAIPSRMTVGHVLEAYVGGYACMEGVMIDGTPFMSVDSGNIQAGLATKGLDRYLDEELTSGITGEAMEERVLVGVPYYLVLRHFSRDKMRARVARSISAFSRQPTSGSEGGGLRMGEMEVDCLLAHGASSILSNMYKHSDEVTVKVCTSCGRMDHKGEESCPHCKGVIASTSVPYSLQVMKYLMDCCGVEITFGLTGRSF